MLKVITATAVATMMALPAAAQTVCGERAKFLDHLSNRYSEAPAAVGLVSNGAVLEVLTSKKGSWTIIVTRPDGVSCILAAGEAWEDLPEIALGPTL